MCLFNQFGAPRASCRRRQRAWLGADRDREGRPSTNRSLPALELRVDGTLDWKLQAAIIDRLLRLPVSFFRQYTVGDLADRTLGIDAIRRVATGRTLRGLLAGVFGLFTMYLPPLFPTLLRTTGAGFSYNIGRIAAAVGTVFFGLFAKVGDFRIALLSAGFLFIPAMFFAMLLPELHDIQPPSPSADQITDHS